MALSDPRGTANQFLYSYTRFTLQQGRLSAGGTLTLTGQPSGDKSSMTITAISWGDGSAPTYTLSENPTRDSHFTHTYRRPGNYRDRIVLIEDGTLAQWDGRVSVGRPGRSVLHFKVPIPGPLVLYTTSFSGASQLIRTLLLRQLPPRGPTATIRMLRKHGGYSFMFGAPTTGHLTISWYLVPKGAHLTRTKPVLVATTTRNLRAGADQIAVKLTGTGRRRLAHAGHLKLTAKGVFIPTGSSPVTAFRPFTLKR
jgi:hypothetical protein